MIKHFKALHGKMLKSFLAVFIMTLVFSIQGSAPVMAAKTGSIEFTLPVVIEGVQASLYYIGEVNSKGSYTLKKKYSSYRVDLSSNLAASTLSSYITRDGLKADKTATSDDLGNIVFDSLDDGVYLAIISKYNVGEAIYTTSPAIIEIPYKTVSESDSSKYVSNWDVSFTTKYTVLESEIGAVSDLTITKIWDDNNSSKRPDSVKVQLLCDGELSFLEDAEVTLNDSNNWTYTWNGLDLDYIWTAIEEEVPDGYGVSVSEENGEVIVTNTKDADIGEEEILPESDDDDDDNNNNKKSSKTTGGKSSSGGTSTQVRSNNLVSNAASEKLPQTGQLWWPVTVLLAAGLLFILLGLLIRPQKSDNI